MTGSENRANIEDVLAEFDGKQDMLDALCAKTKNLIEASLQDANIRYQSVQARVKSRKKLKDNYLDPDKKYQRLDDITDLAGLRIITYYEDDVDRAAEVVKREFDLDSDNSVDKRYSEPDRFGYRAVNYVCRHLKKRTSDVEYKKFAGVPCEIQITSILSHAWSEIEHEWYDLRDAYPDKIKREFSQLAALFEMADAKFLDIRKARTQYERSVAVRVEAMVPNLPVDPVSLRSFTATEPLVAELDKVVALALGITLLEEIREKANERRSAAVKLAGMATLQDVRDRLRQHRATLPEFVRRCTEEKLWPQLPSSGQASKGIALFHLAALLQSLRGEGAIGSFYKKMEVHLELDMASQVAIAKETAAKYSSKD